MKVIFSGMCLNFFSTYKIPYFHYLSNYLCLSQLEKEIENGTWYMTTVSKDVLFKSRDRLGSKRAKPLWTDIMDLLGDDYKKIRDNLYADENDL